MAVTNNWQKKIEDYCKKYNIPIQYLTDTLLEPKVIPMIRGKAFEFSAMLALQALLPPNTWEVKKVPMNAQQGSHDVDVLVNHLSSHRGIAIECKLAGKESYRRLSNGDSIIKVKCMRSRTLGTAMVRSLAPRLGVSEQQLTVHNDQYLPSDFDVVITSIANAFYTTDEQTKLFEWSPSTEGTEFLEFLKQHKTGQQPGRLQDFAFNCLYVAKASDLRISSETGVVCTRESCTNQENCGFVPNYPVIKFSSGNPLPSNGWLPIENSLELFRRFL